LGVLFVWMLYVMILKTQTGLMKADYGEVEIRLVVAAQS